MSEKRDHLKAGLKRWSLHVIGENLLFMLLVFRGERNFKFLRVASLMVGI